MTKKTNSNYDLSGALTRHLAALRTHLLYLQGESAKAKHQTADKKPVLDGRIVEVEKEIEYLEQVLTEG